MRHAAVRRACKNRLSLRRILFGDFFEAREFILRPVAFAGSGREHFVAHAHLCGERAALDPALLERVDFFLGLFCIHGIKVRVKKLPAQALR